MKTKIERKLELFIRYANAQLYREFPEFDFDKKMSLDGAAMLLAWFGLAKPVMDADGKLTWVATASLRTLKDIKMAAREHSAAQHLTRG